MNTLKIFFWLAIFFCCTQASYPQEQPQFSKQEVLEDLTFLKSSLEQAHYNLYAYTPKKAFLKNTEQVKNEIAGDSLSLLQIQSLFQKIISKANTGHAEIDFPIQPYIGYAQKGGTLFPIEIAIEDEKAFVRKNFSGNENVKKGMQLLRINGQDINSILQKIYPQLSAERTYFKNAKLEFWSFPRLFWQVFGEKQTFMIEVKNSSKTSSFKVGSITVGQYENSRKGEIIDPNRYFKYINDVAYLHPGSFGAIENSDEKAYQTFIDSVFTDLKAKKTQTLIIDLRNHPGGDNSFSDYLIAYFAPKPFKWHSKFLLKSSTILKEQIKKYNDTTDTYFRTILSKKDGEVFEYSYEPVSPVKKEKRFTGKVAVLVNRQTYSMAAVIAAQLQDDGFATIVGEETGDVSTLYASQFSYVLPNTAITVKVPKGYMIRPNGNEEVQGVVPNIIIKDHLLDEQDEILDGFLKMLKTY